MNRTVSCLWPYSMKRQLVPAWQYSSTDPYHSISLYKYTNPTIYNLQTIIPISPSERSDQYLEIKMQKLILVVVVMVMAIRVFEPCNAQTICNIPLSGLMACRPSVTPPRPTPPTADCCRALSHANMQCLCSYKNSSFLPSFGVDPKLALQLPAKCKLPAPNC